VNLVVDIGQSGSRVRIGEETISFPHAKNASEQVVQILERIYSEIHSKQFQKAYLSLTGLQGNVGDERPYGELTKKFFGSNEVAVMDDGLAAYSGAIGSQPGVVLTLGGGVVAISYNENRFGHADGKGPIFGDFGGGFWLGQTAMRRAIATKEGRDNAEEIVTLLSEELAHHDALSDKTGVEASKLCISAARTVCMGAESGNAIAKEIIDNGATYLAKTIFAAWKKVNSDQELMPTIAFLGGLSQSKLYIDSIKLALSNVLQFKHVEPIGDHLIGAPLVAEQFPNGVVPLLKWWRS
jgi:glucosamine kinase